MKLLSLNTHSLVEPNYQAKTQWFIERMIEEKIDIFALQEVNQSLTQSPARAMQGYCSKTPLKADNHALIVANKLREAGLDYYWAYATCHIGYDKYDEGLAIFSRYPIQQVQEIQLSKSADYQSYLTRKALFVSCEIAGEIVHIVNSHFGWWHDKQEPFAEQWQALMQALTPMIKANEKIFILGDFNSRSDVEGEGYSLVTSSHFYDLYYLAEQKDAGFTAVSSIDGWQSKTAESMRIDYIFSNQMLKPKYHKVIFNGVDGDIVSDHFAVYTEI